MLNDTIEGGLLAKHFGFRSRDRSQSGEAQRRGCHFGIQWHCLAMLPWDALSTNLQYLNLMEPIMCVVFATSL
jgi:hypothetical protein